MGSAATQSEYIPLEGDEPAAPISVGGWSRRFDRIQDAVAGILLVGMVLVASLQVVSRYVFDAPLPWPEELARWLFLWLVMIGAATATRLGAHIRMGLLPDALSGRARSWVDLVGVALSAAALALVGYLGVLLMLETTLSSVNLGVSYRWLYLALPVGAALSLVALARVAVPGRTRRGVLVAVLVGVVLGAAVSELVERSILVIADPTLTALLGSVLLIVLGVPIAHALLLGAYIAFEAGFLPDEAVVTQFAGSMSTNFVMLAIPFFVLMGALMNAGGLTGALVRVAQSLVGHWRGGLGQVNVLTSTLLGGVSGSSSADTATVTKTLVPEMERHGYQRDFACAITSTAAITATLIPPSISFLIYASLAGVSVGALFMAGVLPGLIFAASLMAAVWALSRFGANKVDAHSRAPWGERGRALLGAAPALALPLGILMLLRAGAVTATEAGAVASVLAVLLGWLVYRKLRLANAWEAILESARDTAVILFLLAASAPLAWLLISEQLPVRLAESLGGISSSMLVLVGIVGVLLVVGIFLEPPPAMVLIVPVLAPLADAVGIDLIHLGVVLVFTIMVGQLTPPVGGLVFISAAIAKEQPGRVFWATRWLYVPIVFLLVLLVLIPGVSLLLPHMAGFR
jgi:C4-dicarboxylate transporter DctM subunit